MATARMTFGSLFGMVTNTANAVGDLAGTLGDGVGMLNKFVASASIDQNERHIVHRTNYREQLILDTSISMAKAQDEALAFVNESPTKAKLFENAQAKLIAAFNAADSTKQS